MGHLERNRMDREEDTMSGQEKRKNKDHIALCAYMKIKGT
jgi:hypothetical protein